MGKLINNYAISHSTLLVVATDAKTLLNDHIDFLLTILPKHTVYVGCSQKPITGLYLEHELVFEHPLFKDGTEVKTNHLRVVWEKPNNNGIVQDNLFLGLEYFLDGVKLFT